LRILLRVWGARASRQSVSRGVCVLWAVFPFPQTKAWAFLGGAPGREIYRLHPESRSDRQPDTQPAHVPLHSLFCAQTGDRSGSTLSLHPDDFHGRRISRRRAVQFLHRFSGGRTDTGSPRRTQSDIRFASSRRRRSARSTGGANFSGVQVKTRSQSERQKSHHVRLPQKADRATKIPPSTL